MAENSTAAMAPQHWLSSQEAAMRPPSSTQPPEPSQQLIKEQAVESTVSDVCPACGKEKSEEVKRAPAIFPESRLETVKAGLEKSKDDLWHAAEELACLFDRDIGGWMDKRGDNSTKKIMEAMERVASNLAAFKQYQVGYAQVKRLAEYSKERHG
jgi:hypothetical protein